MKKLSFKISSLAVAAALIMGGTGCEKIKNFGDTNVNPQVTSDPITAALLTNVESGLGGFASQTQPGYYCQYFAENQYVAVSMYSTPQIDFAGNYSGSLYDLQNIIIYNSDAKTAGKAAVYGSNNNQIAVARILKSYIFWHMTDRWGDIPYSQALQGVTPGYDKQQDIYTGILKELKEAVAQFDGGNGPSGDIIYAGDVSKWKKFANSLRSLVALRMSKQYPNAGQLAATEFAAAVADPAGQITTNADNFVLNYPGGAYNNPWYNFYVVSSRVDYGESKTMTDLLSGLSDGRIGIYGSTSTGTQYGVNLSAPPTGWAKVMSDAFRNGNSPIFIVNAATVLLARAEATERGWITGASHNAQTYYESAIAASFTQWGLSATAANTYATSAAVNYNSGTGLASFGGASVAGTNAVTDSKLKRIWLQRYIAMYPDGAQGWAEWRRTGFPDIKPTVNATNSSKQIPRRYTYGTTEYSTNPTGVAQGIATLSGGDVQDSRVWWDKP